jgi:putative DNA primase/helicase
VLTIDVWGDRLLGVSEMTRLPVRCLWVASANNPRMSIEMIRRSVRIRMDTGTEQPWTRDPSTFKHPDLAGWVGTRRADLVAACLTIIRAWVRAGLPAGDASLGMFESWARTMSGILGVAGVGGLLDNAAEFYETMADDDQTFGAFVTEWNVRFGGSSMGVADLHSTAVEYLDLGSGTDRSQRTLLGNQIKANRDRRFGEVVVAKAGTNQGAIRWKLKAVGR